MLARSEKTAPAALTPEELDKLTDSELHQRSRLLDLHSPREGSPPDGLAGSAEEDGRQRKESRQAQAQISELLERRYVQGRALPYLHPDQLAQVATNRLLARLDSLRKCHECVEQSDFCPKAVQQVRGILFKDSDEWRQAYQDVKSILDHREHVRRGPLERQQAAAVRAPREPLRRRPPR